MLLKKLMLSATMLAGFVLANAEKTDTATVTNEEPAFVLQQLLYDTAGTITLGNGLASFVIPPGFKYLNGKQTEYVMHDLFNNPPSESLGMIVPSNCNDTIPDTWLIEISYLDDGHVKDDDAKDIDYDDLLKDMQKETEESKDERRKGGYPVFDLTGWASPPYYDEKEKKLHWAKRLKVEGNENETLNYNIRILGREGILVLDAIGDVKQFEEIKAAIAPVLAAVNFNNGQAYADYKEGTDKLATYGVAGLIAGGILAKTGLLAKLGLILLKFGKLIALGAVAVGGAVIQFFKGKKADSGEETPTA